MYAFIYCCEIRTDKHVPPKQTSVVHYLALSSALSTCLFKMVFVRVCPHLSNCEPLQRPRSLREIKSAFLPLLSKLWTIRYALQILNVSSFTSAVKTLDDFLSSLSIECTLWPAGEAKGRVLGHSNNPSLCRLVNPNLWQQKKEETA